MEHGTPPPARRGRPRTRTLVLIAVALVLVAVRLALPSIVRRVAVSQADAALVGRIELDDVALSLLRGGIELRGLRVFADELPSSPTPGTEAPPPPGTPPEPVATAGRLWVEIGWLQLVRKTLEIADLELEDFTVRLDRARDGALVLPKPVPGPPEAAPPEPSEPLGWALLVSNVHLVRGLLGFRDFAVSETPTPFEVGIDDLAAEKLAILITTEGLGPGHLQLNARVKGGTLAIDSQISMLAKGPKADTKLDLSDIPIEGSVVYLSQLGWAELKGLLDVSVEHAFEMDGAHGLHGSVALHDVSVSVPALDRPAASFARLDVQLGGVDLVKRHADVSAVNLQGLRLVLRPNEPRPLPVIQALLGGAETPAGEVAEPAGATTAPAPPPAASAPPPAAPAPTKAAAAPSGPPFTWTVTQAGVRDAVVELLRDGQATEIRLEAGVAGLTSDPTQKLAIDLTVTPPAGVLKLAGDATQEPLAFDGRLTIEQLGLPELLAPIALPAAGLVRSGVLNLDWKLAAGPPAGGPGGTNARAVRISGPFSLTSLELADPEAKDRTFGVAWNELAIELRDVYAMGVVPETGAAAPPAATDDGKEGAPAQAPSPPPPHVALDRFRLSRPVVQVTRTADGILLPEALGGPPAAPAPEGAPAEATPPAAPTAPPAAAPPAAAPAPPPVDLTIQAFALEKARVVVEDRSVKPFYRAEIDPLDATASNVRYPGPTIEKLKLDARTKDGATLAVRGAIGPKSTQIDAKLDGLALAPFNPYAASSGYGVGAGSASLESRFRLQDDKYDAKGKLLVKQLEVTGDQGESLFQQQFGIPLSLALALLKDLEGNIALDIPVEGDRGGTRVGLGSIVGQALAKAILGAVTSPLKMIAAVGDVGGKIETLAPQAIAFRPGRAELAEGESGRVGQLGALLARSPGLRIHLRGAAGAEDARWLREQALREEIERTSGVLGSVRHLGERNERKTALAVLTKRAKDEPATVPDEILEWFEHKVAEQTVPPDALANLARERAEKVQSLLAKDHGVALERLPLDPTDATETGTLVPSVALGLGAAASAVAAPPPSAPPGAEAERP